jgi:hypothetical protein
MRRGKPWGSNNTKGRQREKPPSLFYTAIAVSYLYADAQRVKDLTKSRQILIPSAHYSDKVFFFVELLTDWCGGVCYCCSGIPHLLVAEQKTTDVKIQFSLESLVPLWNEKLIKTKSSAGTFEVCLPENWPVDSYRPFRFISGDMGDDEIHSHCHWNLHHVTNGH